MHALTSLTKTHWALQKRSLATKQQILSCQERDMPKKEIEQNFGWLDKKLEILMTEIVVKLKVETEYHPLWATWLIDVKGLDLELAGKLIGFLEGIPRYPSTRSQLWSYSGWKVNSDGTGRTKVAGQPANANLEMKGLTSRVGTSMMKAKGSYYQYYLTAKEGYKSRNDDSSDILIHRRAMRKMIKLFLSHAWEVLAPYKLPEEVWSRPTYAQEHLGHGDRIPPMRDEKKSRRKQKEVRYTSEYSPRIHRNL